MIYFLLQLKKVFFKNSRYNIPFVLFWLSITGSLINVLYIYYSIPEINLKYSTFLIFVSFAWAGPLYLLFYFLREREITLAIESIKSGVETSGEILEKAKKKLRTRPFFGAMLNFLFWFLAGVVNTIIVWQTQLLSGRALWYFFLSVSLLANPIVSVFAYFIIEMMSRGDMRVIEIDLKFQSPIFSLRNKILFTMIFLSGIFVYLLASLSLDNLRAMDNGLHPEIHKRQIEQIVVVSFMCFFYLTIATILLTRSIMVPIRELASSMEKVSRGKIGTRAHIISTDEIGGLSKGFNTMTEGLVERDNIKKLFGHYVSSEIRDSILEGKFEQEGREVEATILFSDIRSFTDLSEKLPPAKVVELLNQYFTEMVTAITNHGGVIDKFIGDAIMAIFGVPRPIGNHAQKAIDAAVEMLKRLEAHNELQKFKGDPQFKIGIGINTGPIIMGNIGSEKRREITVIGDSVNVASRLESATKIYRKSILFSESTQKLVGIGDYLGRVRLKGKSEKVKIYTVS